MKSLHKFVEIHSNTNTHTTASFYTEFNGKKNYGILWKIEFLFHIIQYISYLAGFAYKYAEREKDRDREEKCKRTTDIEHFRFFLSSVFFSHSQQFDVVVVVVVVDEQ